MISVSLLIIYTILIYPKICGVKKENQVYIIKDYKTTIPRFSIRYFLDLHEAYMYDGMVAMTSLIFILIYWNKLRADCGSGS